MIIKQTDPLSNEAASIIGELTNELAERYNEPGGGAFNPEDVLVLRSILLTGVEDGKTIACGALRPVDEDTCEVKRMYVNPDYRGKGFSRQMLAALEEKAGLFGYNRIILETGKKQPEALGLYNKSGYTVIPNYGIYKEREMSVCFEKLIIEQK
jgi:GNAT superfamily N-acetyltransferase